MMNIFNEKDKPFSPERIGEYYNTVVPDTLDLAERAEWGLNHFTSTIDETNDYEMYWLTGPISMSFKSCPLMACQPKAMEAMAMLRIMSGSREGIELEDKMVRMLASCIGDDGIYWVMPTQGKKPWLGPEEMRPYANILGQGRMMSAMAAWYQYTGNQMWKELTDRMIEGLDKIVVVHKDNYAYFPIGGYMEEEYFKSCYIKDKGWKDTSEPMNEKGGEEGSLFNHSGMIAGILSNWYALTGNKTALRLAGELVRFFTKPKFWADYPGGEYPWVSGADHAHWDGHWHGHINTLRAILEYAIITNDPRLKQFVRDGYECAKQKKFARIGFVDYQGCGCGRLIGLAVKLSREGVGDYWEDVDLYIRNHGTEMQFIPDDIEDLEKYTVNGEMKEKVFHAMIGGFSEHYGKVNCAMCCSTHGNMGLFYVWDGMLEQNEGTVRIHLLLNRASPWVDIDSSLPYKGKVVLKIKNTAEIYVRIPLWVNKNSVKVRKENKIMHFEWFGQYIRVMGLKPSETVEIAFDMAERLEKWSHPEIDNRRGIGWIYLIANGPVSREQTPDNTLTMRFRGNTLVELSPLPTCMNGQKTRLYAKRPEKYKSHTVKYKKVTRFSTPFKLKW